MPAWMAAGVSSGTPLTTSPEKNRELSNRIHLKGAARKSCHALLIQQVKEIVNKNIQKYKQQRNIYNYETARKRSTLIAYGFGSVSQGKCQQ
jgi:hypothetical protein